MKLTWTADFIKQTQTHNFPWKPVTLNFHKSFMFLLFNFSKWSLGSRCGEMKL